MDLRYNARLIWSHDTQSRAPAGDTDSDPRRRAVHKKPFQPRRAHSMRFEREGEKATILSK